MVRPLNEVASVLVTGGGGFIGRATVAALVEGGHSVCTYDRDPVRDVHPRAVAAQGELFDVPRLVRVLRERTIDVVVHTAAMSHPEVSIDMPLATFRANVDGTVCVLEACRLAEVTHVVNFSSESVFGDHPGTVTEDSPFAPTTPYAVTKVATEHLAEVYRSLYGMRVMSLRPTEVYGPGNRMPSIVYDALMAALRGEPFALPEGADHSFNLVHVDDVARAALLAVERLGSIGPAYNVAGGPPTTLAELHAAITEQHPGAQLSAGPGAMPDRYCQGAYDPARAAGELGYRPEIVLADGLRDYSASLAAEVR